MCGDPIHDIGRFGPHGDQRRFSVLDGLGRNGDLFQFFSARLQADLAQQLYFSGHHLNTGDIEGLQTEERNAQVVASFGQTQFKVSVKITDGSGLYTHHLNIGGKKRFARRSFHHDTSEDALFGLCTQCMA